MAERSTARTEGQAALDEFPSHGDNPLSGVDLPERSFSWSDEPTGGRNGLSVVLPEGDVTPKVGYLSHGDAAFVLGDVDAYIEAVGDREVEVPSSYSSFDEFESYVGMVTTLSSGYGVGISQVQLEAALRFATGGGRYSTDEISVIGCGQEPFVVRAPDGDFQIATSRVSRPDGYDGPQADVAGVTIEEGDPRVIEGMKQLLADARVFLEIEPADYRGLTSHTHRIAFEGDDADQRRVSGIDCERRRTIATTPDAVLGSVKIETAYGEHYECELEELAYERGEKCRSGICVGYRTYWSDPRQSQRVSMSGRIKANIDYHYLDFRSTSSPELELGQETEMIAEFKPKNEAYKPVSSHL